MSKLDNFFKDKFDNRDFEYKDAYWEAAQQLIEDDEKRRRRRGLWWLYGLLGILIVFIGYFGFSTYNSAIDQVNTTAPGNHASSPPSIQDEAITSIPSTSSSTASSIASPTSATTSAGSKENVTTSTTLSNPSLKKNTSSQKTQNTPSTTQENRSTKQNSKNGIAASNPDPTDLKVITEPKIPAAQDQELPSIKSTSTTTKESTTAQEAVSEERTKEATTPSPETAKTKALQQTNLLENMEALPQEAMPTLPALENIVKLKHKMAAAEQYPKFNWGLRTAGSIYRRSKDLEKWGDGASLGLASQYRFNKNWSIGSELLYSYRNVRADSSLIQDVDAIEYSFGARRNRYTLSAQNLHLLELPLYVQYQRGRHALMGGVQFGYLLAVKGQIDETLGNYPLVAVGVTEANRTEEYAQGWLTKEHHQQWETSFLLGYRYEISPRWQIDLRSAFTFANKKPSAETLAFENYELQTEGLEAARDITKNNTLSLQLGVNWYLNR